MRVQRLQVNPENVNDITYALLDEDGEPISAISGFMQYLRSRGCSPHTLSAYAYDLLHFTRFLQAVSDYVMYERPTDTESPYVFLVGGAGKRRHEPLGYHALVKLFERHCARLGIRSPWVTPHALRHTHATRMFEGGMRELTLQKRLGHASPESTR